MAYCNEQDIVDRKSARVIAELTGDPTGEIIDSEKVTGAIDDYAARINNAVRVKHPDLPFDETDKFLNRLNADGAYLLLERDTENGWSEDQRDDWKLLNQDLEMIAQGKIDLKSETAEEVTAKGTFKSNPRMFNRNSLHAPEDLDV
jgi:phage gp36-like protein